MYIHIVKVVINVFFPLVMLAIFSYNLYLSQFIFYQSTLDKKKKRLDYV